MHIRKFYGSSMKDVLQQAKAELGEDMVILSQKKLDGSRTELTAAVDPPKDAARPWEREGVEEEISEIKQMLFSLVERKEVVQLGKAAQLIYRELKQKGMSGAGAGRVVGDLARGLAPEALMKADSLRGELRRFFASRIATTQPLTNEKMCVVLLGRSGVGKTTTLAKLASRERFLRQRSVSVLSLDAWKMGSREELQRIGQLLDVPVDMVYERSELPDKLARCGRADTLFIDTAGRGLKDKSLRQRIFDVITLCPHTQFHLLLSPHYQRQVLARDVEEYSRLKLSSLVVTKIDEAQSMGGLMDTVLDAGIPLSWMTTGQDIPHDILPAKKGLLFDMMMEA